MVWQDIAIAAVNVLFWYSLIYQVFEGFRKKKAFVSLQTSLFTTLGLIILVITYLTVDLYFSAATAAITGVMWFILLVQRTVYKSA